MKHENWKRKRSRPPKGRCRSTPTSPKPISPAATCCWTHSHRFAHERAVQEFRRALALNPKSDQAHRRLARVFVHVGFFEEALRHADLALTLNPSNAQALTRAHRPFSGRARTKRRSRYSGAFPDRSCRSWSKQTRPSRCIAWGGREAGRPTSGRRYKKSDRSERQSSRRRSPVACAIRTTPCPGARRGPTQENDGQSVSSCRLFRCSALARLRRAGEAVAWLREAAETGFPCYSLFARDPNLDPIRPDPEFRRFMAEMQKSSASLRRTLFPDSN